MIEVNFELFDCCNVLFANSLRYTYRPGNSLDGIKT